MNKPKIRVFLNITTNFSMKYRPPCNHIRYQLVNIHIYEIQYL